MHLKEATCARERQQQTLKYELLRFLSKAFAPWAQLDQEANAICVPRAPRHMYPPHGFLLDAGARMHGSTGCSKEQAPGNFPRAAAS